MTKTAAELVDEFLAKGGSITVEPKTLSMRNAPKAKDWREIAGIKFYKSR